jgi:hypothetical protein
MSFSVIHVVAGLHPSAGGPSRTVVQLTDALARHQELAVTLLTQSLIGDPSVASAAYVKRRMAESPSRNSLRFGLPVRRELKSLTRLQTPALIHSHGLWTPVNHWASVAARRKSMPLIIQPRGMLEPWALNHKALKKRKSQWRCFQRRDLESASAANSDSRHGVRKHSGAWACASQWR